MPSRVRIGSLRWRLALAIAGILVVAVGIMAVAIYRGTGSRLRSQIDHELRGDVAAFQSRGLPTGTVNPRTVEATGRRYVEAQPFSASARLLFERVLGGATVTNQPEVLALRHEPDESAERQSAERRQARALLRARVGYSTVDLADVGRVRLLTRVARARGRPVALVGVGEPLQPVERAQRGVAKTFALAGSVTLLAALIASYLVAGRLSGPLRRMSAIAARVDAGDLTPRIRSKGSRDEVRILADAFDRMLDRLEDAFARQQEFVADASHELRTPLTVIRGQLEVLAREAEPSAEEVRHVERIVGVELVRMQRLVDDLLLLAQAGQRDFVHPREIALAPFVAELGEGIRTTADRQLSIGAVPHGTLRGDPDRMAQALRNLLVNAIAHTRPGGRVELSVRVHGDRVLFTVDDDGPGIPFEERERIFDRFHRTDGARSRSSGGAGLGLAIVQAVAQAHGGRVSVGESALGGARFAVEVPGFAPATPPGGST
jgi:signal transduction histidine kinase